MEREQAGNLLRYIRELFPRWQPTDELAKFWLRQLCRYSEPDVVKDAVEQHRLENKYTQPNIAGINLQVQNAIGGVVSKKNSGNGATGVYIQCVEADEGKPGRLGWYVQLFYGADDKVPDKLKVEKAAETLRAMYERGGGKWIVVAVSNERAMADSRVQLRKGHGDGRIGD